MNDMGENFSEWLLSQRGKRKDAIGQFACIAALCAKWEPFPVADDYLEWHRYFSGRGLHLQTMRAFELSWREWQERRRIEAAVAE